MRVLRAIYIYVGVVLVILSIPFLFAIQLAIDCWRRAK